MDPAFERPLPECKHRPFGLWLMHSSRTISVRWRMGHMNTSLVV